MSRGSSGTASRSSTSREKKLSIRQLVIAVCGRRNFIGSAATVAGLLEEFVPHITPGGLDEFADTLVPLLQERGVFRTEYEGTMLREHLGLERNP